MGTAIAGSFVDTSQSDWNLGTLTNMTADDDPGNLTLNMNASGEYNTSGGYVSQVFDSGEIVSWGVINWSIAKNDTHQTVDFRTRQSNDSVTWQTWSTPHTLNEDVAGISRYIQYMINVTNNDNSSTPNISLAEIHYDFLIPSVVLDSPSDALQITEGSDMTFNCTSGSSNNVSNITLYWNYSGSWAANETIGLTGETNSSSVLIQNITNGEYIWNCLAVDSTGRIAWGASNRSFTAAVVVVDSQVPSIEYSISPQNVVNGTTVTIHVNATDNVGIDTTWAVIDYPGSGEDTIIMTNNADNSYIVTRVGIHNITIFANDTSGNETNVTDYFTSVEAVSFSVNIVDYNNSGIETDLVIYETDGTDIIGSFSSSSGVFSNQTIANGTYDFHFLAFNDDFSVILQDIEIWNNLDKQMKMDELSTPVSGYEATFAAETDYVFTEARIRIFYSQSDIVDENGLTLYRCAGWNFSGRTCNSTWVKINSTIYNSSNYLEAIVSGFSAFSLKQESFCGDGTCDENEDSLGCSADCTCDLGDTRSCALTRQGRCQTGNETCISGAWSGCPLPIVETCNQIDDDCDGIIDNVNGGTNIEETACGCYDGGSPTTEIFDGIDNDCNGIPDDGCVCDEGDIDTCGSNIGECTQGTMTCINCQWSSECVGGREPTREICGNNADDDCDGSTDEDDCLLQTNTTCSYGAIPSIGCRCGFGTYTVGYCCDNGYSNEPCPEFPFWILIVIGAVVLAVAVALHFLTKPKKSKEDDWEELEKKYTPARI